MNWVGSKKGIAIALLVGGFIFAGLSLSGVLGSTQIGLTLKSNQSLNEDLVVHYTFDVDYEQGTYEFGTAGVTTTDLTIQEDSAYSITDDGTYLYIAGQSDSNETNYGSMFIYKVEPITGDMLWSTSTNLTADEDEISDSIFFNGYLYVTGYCGDCGASNDDTYYTMKIDPDNGDMIWGTSTDPSSGDDVAHGITALGNAIYVTGSCSECGIYDSVSGYTIKIDPEDGSMIWATTTDATDNSGAARAIETDGTSIFVAQTCWGCGERLQAAYYIYQVDPETSDMGWSTTTDPSNSNDDVWDMEYKDGYLYLGGACGGNTGDCSGTGTEQFFAAKLSSTDGEPIWATSTYTGSVVSRGYGVAVDDNYMYFIGTCFVTCELPGNDFTVAIDITNGDFVWSTTTGGVGGHDVLVLDDELYAVPNCDGCGALAANAITLQRLDSATGNLEATTTSADSITAIGGVEIVPGKLGQGIEFDDAINLSGDHVNIATPAFDRTPTDTEGMTIAGWFKAGDNSSGNKIVYAAVDDGQFNFGIQPGGTDSFCTFRDSSNSNHGTQVGDSSDDYLPGVWTHFACVYSTTTQQVLLYMQGELATTSDASGWDYFQQANGQQIGSSAGGQAPYIGSVDDIRAYSRELSAAEILRLYQLGATTKVGNTLDSNSDLTDGLVGHWTFDATDVDGFDVMDRSGSGDHGVLFATSSRRQELVDSSGSTMDAVYESTSPTQVWLSDTLGYMVYVDASDSIASASTTDGGENWSSMVLDSETDLRHPTIWYDRWTPNDDVGTRIHIAYADTSEDDLWYTYIDTADNSTSTPVNLSSGLGFSASLGNANPVSLTKAEDGTLYTGVQDGSDTLVASCTSNCTSGGSWVEIPDAFQDGTIGFDYQFMYPLKGTDNIMNIFYNLDSVDLVADTYSATSSSWSSDIFETGPGIVNEDTIGGAMQRSTGDIYFVIGNDTNDFVTQDHDIHVWKFTHSSGSWSQLTDPVTNMSGGLQAAKIIVDQTMEGHLYVVYQRRTTIGDSGTADVYYRYSTDDGTTWSSEIGPLNGTTQENIYGLGVDPMAEHQVRAFFKYADSPNEDDIYNLLVYDIGETEADIVTAGKLGQAIYFDGSDDTIDITDGYTTNFQNDFSIAFWIYDETENSACCNSIVSTYDGTGGDSLTVGIWHNDNPPGLRFYPGASPTNELYYALDEEDFYRQWKHMVVTRQGTNLVLFVDGQQVHRTTNGPSGTFTLTGNDFLRIGSGGRNNQENELGAKLDDVRIYTRAIGTSTVQRLYELGATTKIGTTNRSSDPLKDGLIGHFTFDGYPDTDFSSTTAQFYDVTGSGIGCDDRNGSAQDFIGPGKIGQGFKPDGDNDYISCGDELDMRTNDFFVSAWMKLEPTQESIYTSLITKGAGNGTDEGWMFVYRNNTRELNFWVSDGTTRYDPDGSTTDDLLDREWHHVAANVDRDNSVTFWLDGEFVDAENINSWSAEDIDGSAQPLYIGQWATSHNTNGTLDDIRIYNRTLSTSTIQRIYELGN